MDKKIKIGFSIEATDMGNNQQDIADWVENYIYEQPQDKQQALLDDADNLITLACNSLGWHSVPQNGGLIVNVWEN
jgi:hypothetical protein